MMRKKDYEMVAQLIANLRDIFHEDVPIDTLVESLCEFFEDDNPRFKPELFRKACKESNL